MNLSIKPITDKRVRCEIDSNAPGRAACHLPPEFTVIFFNGGADPEMDLCYEHTIEMTCKVCSEMSPASGIIAEPAKEWPDWMTGKKSKP
jgi:hypothetical protein